MTGECEGTIKAGLSLSQGTSYLSHGQSKSSKHECVGGNMSPMKYKISN